MRLSRLLLRNFRAYGSANIGFFDGIHVIYGDNGSGKTTILEAIHYLALTKSFRTTLDKHLIRNQQDMFRIEGDFQTPQGQVFNSAIAYSSLQGKHLSVNKQKVQKFSEYIGDIPVVLLYPGDLSLSQGSPQQRRRFLDILLSQSSKLYLHHLIQYNRSLKQRNQLLQVEDCHPQLLGSWEENLVTHGTEIIAKRKETVTQLGEIVKQYYLKLSGNEDRIKIVYRTNIQPAESDNMEDSYRTLFEEKRAKELAYGTTLLGPHRDDLLFLINGRPMKVYASQGEHKTFVIALKLGEYQFLQQQRQLSPILLFDDIFGELDANRIQQMLTQLSDIGQVFVTTTSRNFFDKLQQFDTPTRYYEVKDGMIVS